MYKIVCTAVYLYIDVHPDRRQVQKKIKKHKGKWMKKSWSRRSFGRSMFYFVYLRNLHVCLYLRLYTCDGTWTYI